MPPLSARQAHCFLRDKVAILGFEWTPPGTTPVERKTICHSADDECRKLRCSLSGYKGVEAARDPWFDD